jgi:hypothetical protein
MGTDAEKKTMVVSMAKARGASRVRFLAIRVFLSMLAVSFEHLIKTMKKIWKIRGMLDMSQWKEDVSCLNSSRRAISCTSHVEGHGDTEMMLS